MICPTDIHNFKAINQAWDRDTYLGMTNQNLKRFNLLILLTTRRNCKFLALVFLIFHLSPSFDYWAKNSIGLFLKINIYNYIFVHIYVQTGFFSWR